MEWKNPDGSITNGVIVEDGAGNKVTSFSGGAGGSNASVGANGSAAPGSSTEIGYVNALGNLTAASASNPLPVAITAKSSLTTNDGGVAITGATIPSGGSGLIGWLSAIWSRLSGTISVAWSGSPNVTVANSSLAVTGTFYQATQPISATSLPLPSGAANATLQSSILSAVQGLLEANIYVGGSIASAANAVPIYDAYQAAIAANWTSATTANTALTANTAGYDTVIFTIAPSGGAVTAGAIIFEAFDGTNWVTIKAPRTDSYYTDTTFALAGAGTHSWQLPVAGYPQARARLSTAIAGTGTVGLVCIVSSAPDVSLVTVGLDPNQPLPAGANALGSVAQTGTVGTDYSANKPILPNVGSAFGSSGPYANYVLISTVPASPTRNNVDIENTSGAPIAILRDDGAAASGSAPNNACVFSLGGNSPPGAQGGSWSSQTFKGRLQIYAPSSSAQVSIFID